MGSSLLVKSLTLSAALFTASLLEVFEEAVKRMYITALDSNLPRFVSAFLVGVELSFLEKWGGFLILRHTHLDATNYHNF